jgi:hypothetical protein
MNYRDDPPPTDYQHTHTHTRYPQVLPKLVGVNAMRTCISRPINALPVKLVSYTYTSNAARGFLPQHQTKKRINRDISRRTSPAPTDSA